jgi:hypothetical protein
MLSEAQKREAEQAGRSDVKRFWGDALADGIAAAIVDIRVHVVEEGWYGKPLYDYGRNSDPTVEFYGLREHQPSAAQEARPERAKDHGELER